MSNQRQILQIRNKKLGLLIFDARKATRRGSEECAQAIGVTPEQLGRVPHSICLAGSVTKARAAIGAARAGLYNVLVTDAPTARAMDAFLAAEVRSPG